MKKRIILIGALLFLQSCSQNKESTVSENISTNNLIDSVNDKNSSSTITQNPETLDKNASIDPAKEWLENIFKCKNGNKFCFYLEIEEKATTKKFYQFMIDSEQIFGATHLSEDEIPHAKKKYQEKWSGIYPLRKEMEPWLFGRAQDNMENIKEVKIEKISDLKYRVFIDDDFYQTLNEVTLVENNNSYLIDYCKTEFLQ